MAIAPTGALYKAFSFDGVSSRQFGAYLTGEGVYNAPERDVEMIAIPGRNGAYPSDQGRWNNVEITYQATIAAHTEQDFREAMSGLRSLLCSRKGYARLEDDYHPDEYRLAVYKSGLEAEPIGCTQAEFSIVFDCKPQRYLKSGENAISVSSGGTVTNPTAFDASPMLEVYGYGTISFGGYNIEINNEQIGRATLLSNYVSRGYQDIDGGQSGTIGNEAININANNLAQNGDTITLKGYLQYALTGESDVEFRTCTVTSQPSYGTASGESSLLASELLLQISNVTLTFTKGTSSSITMTAGFSYTYKISGTTYTETVTLTFIVSYDASTDTITVGASHSPTNVDPVYSWQKYIMLNSVVVVSTKSILGTPTYVDCDIGEAYMISGGKAVSLDRYIDLGSDLPTLPPGSTAISYNNTVTKLDVVPRWWRI